MLSAMHAAYLTVCVQPGIPLARWGIRLAVLLEIVGITFPQIKGDTSPQGKHQLDKQIYIFLAHDWIGP